MTARNHYDVLGIELSASANDVREAYRGLAREFHPDRVASSAAGGADRMSAINEAYRVLSDPGRRALYDASLRSGGSTATRSQDRPSGADEVEVHDHDDGYEFRVARMREPPKMPWRTIVIAGILAIGGVIVLSQFNETDGSTPDGILRVGDCVEIDREVYAREVLCTGEGDLVVRQFIPFDRECSNAWLPLQDRQGMGIACVEMA